MIALLFAALGLALAAGTTRWVARYTPTGMAAGMAAMMAAMGTGLSVGYAAGMAWDLGWATLTGVAAGFAHGLWTGRRYGPMAALDGAGGGAMGGLMGPMLAVMLLYLPLSLLWTAGLMLLLQWAFGLGAVYLVAAAAGTPPQSRLFQWVGWLLGAGAGVVGDECIPASPPVAATQPIPPGRRGLMTAAVMLGVGGLAAYAVYAARAVTIPAGESQGWDSATVVTAPTGPDGVQEVAITLQAPYYAPPVTEVRRGVPVRLTLTAVGDPG